MSSGGRWAKSSRNYGCFRGGVQNPRGIMVFRGRVPKSSVNCREGHRAREGAAFGRCSVFGRL